MALDCNDILEILAEKDSKEETNREKITRDKGKSLLEFPQEYAVIDIETTGLSPQYDDIIELSAIRIKDGEITDTFSTLVQPDEARYIDEDHNLYFLSDFIVNLTGITDDMLLDAPKLSEALPPFLDFIGNCIIVGHNVNFDINFIYDKTLALFDRIFNNDFCDLLRISRRIFPDFDNHKLITLAENFHIAPDTQHRAEADCVTTFQCFEFCRNYTAQNDIDIVPYYFGKSLDLRNIKAHTNTFDPSHSLYQKYVVFTGTLEKMSRKDAAQFVADFGGIPQNGVTKQTNFLVLGNNDYCSTIKDGKSAKQKKAEALILNGQDLKILPEDIFYDMVLEG